MDTVVDAAFIVAVVAFIKTHFGLQGRGALTAAFVIALLFGISPLIWQYVPAVGPVFDVILKTFALFLGAAGGYDAVVEFGRKRITTR